MRAVQQNAKAFARALREDPSLSRRAAIGKAAGILGGQTGHKFKPRKKRMGNR